MVFFSVVCVLNRLHRTISLTRKSAPETSSSAQNDDVRHAAERAQSDQQEGAGSASANSYVHNLRSSTKTERPSLYEELLQMDTR